VNDTFYINLGRIYKAIVFWEQITISSSHQPDNQEYIPTMKATCVIAVSLMVLATFVSAEQANPNFRKGLRLRGLAKRACASDDDCGTGFVCDEVCVADPAN
jgi:hypothetical protein